MVVFFILELKKITHNKTPETTMYVLEKLPKSYLQTFSGSGFVEKSPTKCKVKNLQSARKNPSDSRDTGRIRTQACCWRNMEMRHRVCPIPTDLASWVSNIRRCKSKSRITK